MSDAYLNINCILQHSIISLIKMHAITFLIYVAGKDPVYLYILLFRLKPEMFCIEQKIDDNKVKKRRYSIRIVI